MEIQSTVSPIIIGYYPIRLKGQVSRLLCQYLHINYQDKFFDPLSWNQFKEKQAKNWIFRELPFVIDGNFIVTGSFAITTYLTEKAGKKDLFGRTLQDKTKIDIFCKKGDILMVTHATNWCSQKHDQVAKKQYLDSHWQKKIKPLLMLYEHQCQLSPWFFPYVTIIDFQVYEIMNQISVIYPKEVIKFNKLLKLRERVAQIPQIASYEKSQRAVNQCCPTFYFKCFKEEKINSLNQSNSTSSQISKKQMDLQ